MNRLLAPAEHLVALVDMGPVGRALSIGSRLDGEILQWFDGHSLHLVRGRILSDRSRHRSFQFERAADKVIMKFVELSAEAFEDRFRRAFPDAPCGLNSAALADWLRSAHGLWPRPGL